METLKNQNIINEEKGNDINHVLAAGFLSKREQKRLNIAGVSKSVCRYYGTNDCEDFEPYKGILYGLCKCENDNCTYKDKPNKDDIVESEL